MLTKRVRTALASVLTTAALACLLCGAALAENADPAPTPEPTELDLRGRALTVEQFEAQREAHPDIPIYWDVPIAGRRIDSQSRAITVPDYTARDRAALDYFPDLESVDASGSTDIEALTELYRSMPNLSVRWSVPIGDKLYSSRTAVLQLEGPLDLGQVEEKLAWFPALKRLEFSGGPFSSAELRAFQERNPGLAVFWPIEVCSQTFSSATDTISLAGRTDLTQKSLQEIREKAEEFPRLKTVDLTGCGFDGPTLHKLDQQLGKDVDVRWTFDLYGVMVCSTDKEIDISENPNVRDNGKALEEAIPWMSHLTKVVMCNVEISNKDIVALYEKYLPLGIRIVWMVQIKFGGIRTDSDHFIPYPESGARQYPNMVGLSNLYYCPDLIALDLGHSNIKDLGYLDIMPHLQYLILADSWVMDIEAVGHLKELRWLELFQTGVRDISPLAGCTSLEHLNICYIIAPGENIVETLSQMPWLKRVWCCGTLMNNEQLAQLHEALPDTEIWDKAGDESTGSTWRYDPAYFEMRDAFHMYYMDDDGNTIQRPTDEELAAIHKKVWGY